jgi:hypothetical protein
MMKKRKLTKAEREERDEHLNQMLENAERTRRLAAQAQAKLDAKQGRRRRIAFW